MIKQRGKQLAPQTGRDLPGDGHVEQLGVDRFREGGRQLRLAQPLLQDPLLPGREHQTHALVGEGRFFVGTVLDDEQSGLLEVAGVGERPPCRDPPKPD